MHDRAALQGMIFSVGLGGMSMSAKSLLAGRDLPDSPQEFLVESINQSGPLGVAMEISSLSGKFGGPSLNKFAGGSGSRNYQSRSVFAAAAGPALGQGVDAAIGLTGLLSGEGTRSDLYKLRKQIWFQNLPIARQTIDRIEEGFGDVFDLDGKRRPYTKFKKNIEDTF